MRLRYLLMSFLFLRSCASTDVFHDEPSSRMPPFRLSVSTMGDCGGDVGFVGNPSIVSAIKFCVPTSRVPIFLLLLVCGQHEFLSATRTIRRIIQCPLLPVHSER